MEKRYEDQMKELNSDLIHIIETTIKEARNKRDDYQWNNPENWFRVLESLKEYHEKLSDDITQYAEVQVGLAKFLDYYSMKWMEKEDVEKIQKLVSQIVSLSLSIIILS